MKTLSVEWNGERITLTDELEGKLFGALGAMLHWQEDTGVYDRLFPKKAISFFMDECKVRYVSHSLVEKVA